MLKQCRVCKNPYLPTPSQRAASNFICSGCRKARYRERLAAAQAIGNTSTSTQPNQEIAIIGNNLKRQPESASAPKSQDQSQPATQPDSTELFDLSQFNHDPSADEQKARVQRNIDWTGIQPNPLANES